VFLMVIAFLPFLTELVAERLASGWTRSWRPSCTA
jgi:uncharacterized membrane protein